MAASDAPAVKYKPNTAKLRRGQRQTTREFAIGVWLIAPMPKRGYHLNPIPQGDTVFPLVAAKPIEARSFVSGKNPYQGLDGRAFWRSAIAEKSPLEVKDVYRPRFEIPQTAAIATAGSCFAQHISRQFKERGYQFLDVEPPPPLLPAANWPDYGYGLYSARYGNVYTARQLWQLIQRAFGRFEPAENVWEQDGRFFDPFRPAIEPNGFASLDEYQAIQQRHLKLVATMFERASLFVFTFGLTEGWVNRHDGAVYPVCPGTAAGTYDETKYAFHNFTFVEILQDMKRTINFLLRINRRLRFLFTVSPVPLTATASGQHVLPATVYSKSVLRAVCGQLYETYDCVDYFPSYELVASHPFRAMFFEPNLRGVSAAGVQYVMGHFFGGRPMPSVAQAEVPRKREISRDEAEEELVCEELILEKYA